VPSVAWPRPRAAARRGVGGPPALRAADRATLAGWRAAGIAVIWMVGTSLVPLVLFVLVGWLSSGLLGGLADPFRLAINIWLAGHGVPLDASAGPLTLHPLGLTLLVLALLWRGGRWAGRRAEPSSLAAAGRLTAMLAVGYGASTGLLAVAGTGALARPNLMLSAAAGVVLAATVGGLGVLSGASLLSEVRGRIPLVWRVAIDAGTGAFLVMLGLATVLLAGVLVAQRATVYDLAVAVGPDAAGWPLLLLLNVLLVPNAVLAAMAYASGPGFAVGVGTSVSIGGSHLGPLPPLSLLAAVPGAPEPNPITYAVIAIPLLAGLASGLLAVRRSRTLRPERCALAGLAAGPVAGVLALVATWAASGGLGSGQLASIGSTAWLVGAAVTVEVGVIGAATAWIGCPRGRASQPAVAAPVSVPSAETAPATTRFSPAVVAKPKAPVATPAIGSIDHDEPTVTLVRPTAATLTAPPAPAVPADPLIKPSPASTDAGDRDDTVVLKRQTG
jgi:hypothetical protein